MNEVRMSKFGVQIYAILAMLFLASALWASTSNNTTASSVVATILVICASSMMAHASPVLKFRWQRIATFITFLWTGLLGIGITVIHGSFELLPAYEVTYLICLAMFIAGNAWPNLPPRPWKSRGISLAL
ncbi:MAG TPA: hypothetical protein VJJ76_00045 [archaeon]|nr:hypothetical protein [archaeon]